MHAEDNIVCELAGITTRSLREAYRDLEEKSFISPAKIMGERIWKVHITPQFWCRRESLNENMIKRYGGTF